MKNKHLVAVVFALQGAIVGCGGVESEQAVESEQVGSTAQRMDTTTLPALTCDTSYTYDFPVTQSVDGSYYVLERRMSATCAPVGDRRYLYISSYDLGGCMGTCPRLEVYDDAGVLQKTFTDAIAGSYVRVPVSASSSGFRIRTYRPTWFPSSTTKSFNINVQSW